LNLNLIPRNWKPWMFLARKPSNEYVDNVAKGGPSYLSELPRRTCRACFVVVTMESKSILKRYWVRTSRCHVGSWCIWRKMDEDCAYFSDLDYKARPIPTTGIFCGFAIFYLFDMKQGIMYCGVAAPRQEQKKNQE